MIETRKDLEEYLNEDIKYYKEPKKQAIRDRIEGEHLREIWKFIKYLRKSEYYLNNKKNILSKILKVYYVRKKNKLGNKLGFYIQPNTFDRGLTICHHGNIIVNGYSRIGKNCILHGDNCIGNNGKDKKAPIIGNNVNIGVGAKIIGNIFIADNINIGANAVVNKSFYEEGITLVGVPAKKLERKV